jgi:deoxyribodipyrimidine photo-lyase
MAMPVLAPPATLTPVHGNWNQHIPTASELGLPDDPCPYRQIGGREAALEILDSFLCQRGRDYRYQMSSPVTAFDASSRLSPHLSWGTISMREIAQAAQARLQSVRLSADPDDRRWRGSLVSFTARLHWHCHFMQKLEDEPRIEFENVHRAYDGLRPIKADPARLEAWARGATGFPFIDACMRALNQHGWINFRMRAMLMSFASYHLWLPWRDSGLHLARQFVDYEPGIHWSQGQMQSGTTGINTIRIYNPVKQGLDQDPSGEFVRQYVPELGPVPDAYIHQPWLWPGASGLQYPAPIVDHEAAARAAKAAIFAIRQGARHRDEAQRIAEKHGSRKAGIPITGRKRKSADKPAPKTQLILDL